MYGFENIARMIAGDISSYFVNNILTTNFHAELESPHTLVDAIEHISNRGA